MKKIIVPSHINNHIFHDLVDIKIPLEFPSFECFHIRCTEVQHINKHTKAHTHKLRCWLTILEIPLVLHHSLVIDPNFVTTTEFLSIKVHGAMDISSFFESRKYVVTKTNLLNFLSCIQKIPSNLFVHYFSLVEVPPSFLHHNPLSILLSRTTSFL
jgi:hypothetical protein